MVRDYFAAINHHNWALAWRLGGKNTGQSYAVYKQGFAGTRHDTVRILGHSGDIVRARIIAKQKDGTLKVFQGSYRVTGGAIVHAHIYRILFK